MHLKCVSTSLSESESHLCAAAEEKNGFPPPLARSQHPLFHELLANFYLFGAAVF
jgi:hypothetical protein